MGAPATRVSVDGTEFTVRQLGDEVEVIRTSMEYGPRKSEVLTKAVLAIQHATGCRVDPDGFDGDHNIILARVYCP